MTIKKTLMLLFITIIAFALCSCAEPPFRLHVIANSDSARDQQLKLCVRDAVLYATQEGISECGNASAAEEYISTNIGIILETANDTLQKCGADYAASATVGTYHFPNKTYQDVKYPEGDYRALRVILGDGDGQNWWCVMFPPLCLSEIEQEDDVEYASYLAELFETVFGKSAKEAP